MLFTEATLSGHVAFSKVVDMVDIGATCRRRDRRLRAFWRHEHMSTKMALATATHHSAV